MGAYPGVGAYPGYYGIWKYFTFSREKDYIMGASALRCGGGVVNRTAPLCAAKVMVSLSQYVKLLASGPVFPDPGSHNYVQIMHQSWLQNMHVSMIVE